MTDSVKGKTVADAVALLSRLQRMVTATTSESPDDLGTLSVLAGVRELSGACEMRDAPMAGVARGRDRG